MWARSGKSRNSTSIYRPCRDTVTRVRIERCPSNDGKESEARVREQTQHGQSILREGADVRVPESRNPVIVIRERDRLCPVSESVLGGGDNECAAWLCVIETYGLDPIRNSLGPHRSVHFKRVG